MTALSLRFVFSLVVFLLFCGIMGFSQERTVKAIRTENKIKIDGKLDESEWKNAESISDFIGFYPVFDVVPGQKSEVKVIYDDKSIYFGATLYDSNPDSIYTELTVRDKYNGNVDYFAVSLNPNKDGQNLYEFVVSAANVQTDIRISEIDDDYAWDAVWYSATRVTDESWVVEIEIPYSAIRFQNAKNQSWSVNFFRTVRRTREVSSWSPVDQTLGSAGSQMGIIEGINNIEAPLRLSLMPYVSGYVNSYENSWGRSFSGGMDLKLGLSETYTLDMTLIPDFGQTKSDNIVLNLTPHETYYSENRPFFTEGTELYNKCDLFYSRRIGKTPSLYGSVENMGLSDTINILKNPSSAGLINAFKISGRGEGNLAVGVFNAVTGNTYAKLQYPNGNEESILTEHATNYNILVLDQSMGKNSFVNFTNANVLRPGDNYWSNVTAAMFKIMDKTNKYCVSALGSFSTRNMSGANIDNGWYLDASLGKKNGTWVYEIGTQIISDDYNPNDLGYMTRFNQISNYAEIGYRRFSRFWIFNETMNTIDITHRSLFENASYVGANIHLTNYATTTKHLSIWNNLTIPLSDEYDYYEPRTEGKFYLRPSLINENFFISTDYRKRLAFDFRGGVYFDGIERHGYWGSISPLTRFGKRVSLRYQFSADYDLGAAGWVSNTNDDIIFGSRDVITFTNSFSSSIVFTNKLSL